MSMSDEYVSDQEATKPPSSFFEQSSNASITGENRELNSSKEKSVELPSSRQKSIDALQLAIQRALDKAKTTASQASKEVRPKVERVVNVQPAQESTPAVESSASVGEPEKVVIRETLKSPEKSDSAPRREFTRPNREQVVPRNKENGETSRVSRTSFHRDAQNREQKREWTSRSNPLPPAPTSQNSSESEDADKRKTQEIREFFKRKFAKNRENSPESPQESNQSLASEPRVKTPAPPAPKPEIPLTMVNGILEITPKGFGFLNHPGDRFDPSANRTWVSQETIRRYALRNGQEIMGRARVTPRGTQLQEVSDVNGISPEQARYLPYFEDLKAVNPRRQIHFEAYPDRFTTRVVDMISPVAYGQRGLIVAPPRTGKTTLLLHMAEAVLMMEKNLHLMILLVDERPEEVTEFRRTLPKAEIYASSNDMKPRDHIRIAELCIERAKRIVEAGKNVIILMDSITRLTRAYNNSTKGNGKTMSGGIDAQALEAPRRLFAAARNTREAGSLTILATALIETNSRMDELIFQEFKGTGNMELVLNRRIAEQYIYPAVDILKSGTRREELILPDLHLHKIRMLRRAFAGMKPIDAINRLLFFMKKSSKNDQMLIGIKAKSDQG